MKLLNIFFGIALSLGIPFIGILITSQINHVTPVIITLIATPIIAVYLKWFTKHKFIGIGMLIGLIPLSVFVFTFIIMSRLH